MPYTCAVISEILRQSSLVPFAPHTATSNIEVDGYRIPKGSVITGMTNNVVSYQSEIFFIKMRAIPACSHPPSITPLFPRKKGVKPAAYNPFLIIEW